MPIITLPLQCSETIIYSRKERFDEGISPVAVYSARRRWDRHWRGGEACGVSDWEYDYAKSPLKNPRNDAEDMAAILRKTGFDVTHLQDLDRRGMARSISQFARNLEQSGATGLFYYAGHGAESAGKSYLLPLGMEVENASELEFEGIDVQRLLRQMQVARNGLNIVIIDACRNNPYRSLRSLPITATVRVRIRGSVFRGMLIDSVT